MTTTKMKPVTLLLQDTNGLWTAMHIRYYSQGHYMVSYRKTADNPFPQYDSSKQTQVSQLRHYIGVYMHKNRQDIAPADFIFADNTLQIEQLLGVVLPQNMTTI